MSIEQYKRNIIEMVESIDDIVTLKTIFSFVHRHFLWH